MLIDTHCHIHERDFPLNRGEVLTACATADVTRIICVGTSMESSRDAINFAKKLNGKLGVKIFAALGVHPHETADFSRKDLDELEKLIRENPKIIKGVGEIGLDYFYEFSPRETQIKVLEMQLQLAIDFNLPVSFHVRDSRDSDQEVWRDFWPVVNNFREKKLRAVLHSYTEQNRENLAESLAHNFYFGVNGISTFAKSDEQNLWRDIPLAKIVLETDAPFLAPVPFRGQPNQPSFIPQIAKNLAKIKSENYDEIAKTTTANAEKLFSL